MTNSSDKPVRSTEGTFSPGDLVVYPGHGLGEVTCIETQLVAGQEVRLFVVSFARERMTLKVPLLKAKNAGLRKLSSNTVMNAALAALKTRATGKRAMWSRRALEYAAKIKSGNPLLIAEVVRDLHRRPTAEKEQSYSERIIYEQALERLSHEVAAVQKIEPEAAAAKVVSLLSAA